MAVNRRTGAESAVNRAALMDAVEAVMRADGYGALTARYVAKRADLKYHLVFYYFGTMDELLLATYRRHIGRYRETMEAALQSDRPLHASWAVHSDPDAILNAEFLALANHNEAVRAETIAFGEQLRTMGLDLVALRMRVPPEGAENITPAAVLMAINHVGSLLALENAIGIKGAHEDIRRLINWCVDRLEPEAEASKVRR